MIFLQPYAGDSNHWICVYTIKDQGVVYLIDSLNLPLSRSSLCQISNLYADSVRSKCLKIKRVPVQQQKGTVDCGLFAVGFAVEVCNGNDVTSTYINQRLARNHLCKSLTKNQLTVFPRSDVRRVQQNKSEVHNVKLYCVCKMPDM